MPLTKWVGFKTKLERGNRIQVPKLLRWEFKLEPEQVLRVVVQIEDSWGCEKFYARMNKDGRICVPKIICNLLKVPLGKQDIAGVVLEVELAPAAEIQEAQDEEAE